MKALSESELDVLDGASRGESIDETARRRVVSPRTIKSQRNGIVSKIGAQNITHAVAIAIVSGVLNVRPHHLTWNGTEWVDDRCGCRYHPDDRNRTHGGGPHVHPCQVHEPDHR